MKRIDKRYLLFSFLLLVIACSLLSMSAVATEYRYTWVAMNPWNGVEGIAFTVGYFLRVGKASGLMITAGLLLIIWWRLYVLLKRIFGGRQDPDVTGE